MHASFNVSGIAFKSDESTKQIKDGRKRKLNYYFNVLFQHCSEYLRLFVTCSQQSHLKEKKLPIFIC